MVAAFSTITYGKMQTIRSDPIGAAFCGGRTSPKWLPSVRKDVKISVVIWAVGMLTRLIIVKFLEHDKKA